jgi:hypothetical protein
MLARQLPKEFLLESGRGERQVVKAAFGRDSETGESGELPDIRLISPAERLS